MASIVRKSLAVYKMTNIGTRYIHKNMKKRDNVMLLGKVQFKHWGKQNKLILAVSIKNY